MPQNMFIVPAWVLLAAIVPCSFAQSPAPAVLAAASLVYAFAQDKSANNKSDTGSEADLQKVLSQMDAVAANFRTTEASFVWDQFQKVVNETDQQKGKVYFRRASKEIQMMAEITEPDHKFVLYSDGKVQVYQPKIEQVTTYSPGKNRSDIESFLVLGFGGGGHDLLKSFEVKYEGVENVQGIQAAKLDLIPKSAHVRGMFEHILLWVDPARGISVQQQVFEPSGDYRLAKYTDIQINSKLPDNTFKLKTSGKTKYVSPQG
jgi:outer membrane lipoprotein-sorting protein